jgi:hypothetical protein
MALALDQLYPGLRLRFVGPTKLDDPDSLVVDAVYRVRRVFPRSVYVVPEKEAPKYDPQQVQSGPKPRLSEDDSSVNVVGRKLEQKGFHVPCRTGALHRFVDLTFANVKQGVQDTANAIKGAVRDYKEKHKKYIGAFDARQDANRPEPEQSEAASAPSMPEASTHDELQGKRLELLRKLEEVKKRKGDGRATPEARPDPNRRPKPKGPQGPAR